MHLTAMTATTPTFTLTPGTRADHVFPTLTPGQIARIAAHGRVRRVAEGEVLLEPGEQVARIFVVTEGQIEVLRPTGATEEVVALFGPGQFTGEVAMLSGRRGLAPGPGGGGAPRVRAGGGVRLGGAPLVARGTLPGAVCAPAPPRGYRRGRRRRRGGTGAVAPPPPAAPPPRGRSQT